MRTRKTHDGLTVQATAGAHVVMLGMSMAEADCVGLRGFAIQRTDHAQGKASWLSGLKSFAATAPRGTPNARFSTEEQPIQGFAWSDFSARPGTPYTYRVVALGGTPQKLRPLRALELDITTEAVEGAAHTVCFNRGAAASQEYARRFHNLRPDAADPDDPRWAWLSRGAAEALLGFVERARGPGWGLRVAAYEFSLDTVADALHAARGRGADVRVLYDAGGQPGADGAPVFPRDANRATAKAARIKGLCVERVTRSGVLRPPLSHHKFMVLLHHGKPVAVLTGSTNFSRGGVFGQSNVVHVVESREVAARYLACWNAIATNPAWHTLKDTLTDGNGIPSDPPAAGTHVVFSPQRDLTTLAYYAKLAKEAQQALFMTFAFGMNKLFVDAYAEGRAPRRYALMDKLLAPGVRADQRAAAIAAMTALRARSENRFAVGNRIVTNTFDRWLSETLTGLNSHVEYIHTKFMLVDPLGQDPLVITGSANFSDASTTSNDENMLLIRGDTRVADIYLGEYMRLWNHYAFREFVAAHAAPSEARVAYLDPGDGWWRGYFGNTARSRQRLYFSGSGL